MTPMIRFMMMQVSLGALVGSMLLAALIAAGGPVLQAMLAEAMEQPAQMVAIWLGAVGPFAVGFLATALALSGFRPDDGPRGGHAAVDTPLRRVPVRARSLR